MQLSKDWLLDDYLLILTFIVKSVLVKMDSFGDIIKRHRMDKKLPLRKVAAYLDIDQAILSKIERGKRKATREQVLVLARFYKINTDHLLVAWLSDKIVAELAEESSSMKALQVAEEKIAYKTFKKTSKAYTIKKIKSVLQDFPEIEKAWLFGSYARNDDAPNSDIDILIDVPYEKEFTLFDIAEIQERLRLTINRSVDVVMRRALKSHVKERIQKDLELVYEAR